MLLVSLILLQEKMDFSTLYGGNLGKEDAVTFTRQSLTVYRLKPLSSLRTQTKTI